MKRAQKDALEKAAREALQFHLYRDKMNAALHREPLKLSPLTVALAEAVGCPPCPDCGGMMFLSGSTFRCHNCGGTSGCS